MASEGTQALKPRSSATGPCWPSTWRRRARWMRSSPGCTTRAGASARRPPSASPAARVPGGGAVPRRHPRRARGDGRSQRGGRGALGAGRVRGPAMIELLRHEDPDQRKFAADILGQLGPPGRAAADGRAGGRGSQRPGVRRGGAGAHGLRRGGPGAGGLLRQPEPLLRLAALEGLAQLHRPPPLPVVVPLLADLRLQRSAYRVMGLIPSWPPRSSSAGGCARRRAPSARPRSARWGRRAAVGRRAARSSRPRPRRRPRCPAPAAHPRPLLRGGRCAPERWWPPGRCASPRRHRGGGGGPRGSAAARGVPRCAAGSGAGRKLRSGHGEAVRARSRRRRPRRCWRWWTPRDVPPLSSLARVGRSLRAVAVKALGRTQSPDAVAPLVALLGDAGAGGPAVRALVLSGGGRPRRAQGAGGGGGAAPSPAAVLVLARVGGTARCPRCGGAGAAADPRCARRPWMRRWRWIGPGCLELARGALADEAAPVRAAGARALGQLGRHGAATCWSSRWRRRRGHARAAAGGGAGRVRRHGPVARAGGAGEPAGGALAGRAVRALARLGGMPGRRCSERPRATRTRRW